MCTMHRRIMYRSKVEDTVLWQYDTVSSTYVLSEVVEKLYTFYFASNFFACENSGTNCFCSRPRYPTVWLLLIQDQDAMPKTLIYKENLTWSFV